MADILPTANLVPEKLTGFRVYNQGTDLLGVADVELPDLEYMTETVSGAGIAGEMESPVLGHFKSLGLKLKWRTLTKGALSLLAPKAHHLDLRGSIQAYDAGAGTYKSQAVKVVVRGTPKKGGLGKFETGKPMDNETELEALYLKVWLDSVEKVEIDKLNCICRIDGEDVLAEVRRNLGLEV